MIEITMDGGYGFKLIPNEWSYKASKDPNEPNEPMYACWDCGAMERR